LGVEALPLLQHSGLQRSQARLLRGAPLLQLAQPLLRAIGRLPGVGRLQAGGICAGTQGREKSRQCIQQISSLT
jgi:hypothetical protein